MISSTGTLVRSRVDEVSIVGRNTQGVRLIRLANDERLAGVVRIPTLAGDESETTPAGAADGSGSVAAPDGPSTSN